MIPTRERRSTTSTRWSLRDTTCVYVSGLNNIHIYQLLCITATAVLNTKQFFLWFVRSKQQFEIPEEEAEWVGLSLEEAVEKQRQLEHKVKKKKKRLNPNKKVVLPHMKSFNLPWTVWRIAFNSELKQGTIWVIKAYLQHILVIFILDVWQSNIFCFLTLKCITDIKVIKCVYISEV